MDKIHEKQSHEKVYQKFASEEVLCYYELLKDNRQTDILAANAAE